MFTHITACMFAKSLFRTLYTGGFSRFVTSTPAPVATGRNENYRAGFAPARKQRLGTAHEILQAIQQEIITLFPAGTSRAQKLLRCAGLIR